MPQKKDHLHFKVDFILLLGSSSFSVLSFLGTFSFLGLSFSGGLLHFWVDFTFGVVFLFWVIFILMSEFGIAHTSLPIFLLIFCCSRYVDLLELSHLNAILYNVTLLLQPQCCTFTIGGGNTDKQTYEHTHLTWKKLLIPWITISYWVKWNTMALGIHQISGLKTI